MLLIFRYIIFIFALSNHVSYAYCNLSTKDTFGRATGESPELTTSSDAAWFDTTAQSHFIFSMSNHAAAEFANNSSNPATTAATNGNLHRINNILNDFFNNHGSALPNDILCYHIQATAEDNELTDRFKLEVIGINAELIRLLSSLNELRDKTNNLFIQEKEGCHG